MWIFRKYIKNKEKNDKIFLEIFSKSKCQLFKINECPLKIPFLLNTIEF